MSVSSALNKELFEEGMRRMSKVYEDAVALCRTLYACREPECGPLKEELELLVSRIIAEVSGGSRASLRFFFRDYPDVKEYTYCHAVNVCLLSVEFGLGLSYDSGALRELAKAAFMHEIGMTSVAPAAVESGAAQR